MMVFVGVRLCDEKYVVGPCEPCWAKELKTLVGLEAACELSCEKLRTDEVAKAAARGDDRDAASVREFRSKLEPVEASSRDCDAMLSVWGEVEWWWVMTRSRAPSSIGGQLVEGPTSMT
jgi:hypothetical protein